MPGVAKPGEQAVKGRRLLAVAGTSDRADRSRVNELKSGRRGAVRQPKLGWGATVSLLSIPLAGLKSIRHIARMQCTPLQSTPKMSPAFRSDPPSSFTAGLAVGTRHLWVGYAVTNPKPDTAVHFVRTDR